MSVISSECYDTSTLLLSAFDVLERWLKVLQFPLIHTRKQNAIVEDHFNILELSGLYIEESRSERCKF